jgi:hypothetical protein
MSQMLINQRIENETAVRFPNDNAQIQQYQAIINDW